MIYSDLGFRFRSFSSVLSSCSEFVDLFCSVFVFIRDLRILYSISSSCSGSVSLMKVMMGLRMRLNLMSRSRRAGHADLKC